MKSSVRLATVGLAAAALIVGMFIGLRPLTASVTQISPEVRDLTVPCGIGFLPGVPDKSNGAGDTVEVPTEPGVVLPRQAYAEHCALVTGWRPYVGWGLTGLGIAGLALLFASARRNEGKGAYR